MYRLRFILMMSRCFLTPVIKLSDTFQVSFITIPFVDTDLSRLFTQTYFSYMGICRWHFVFHSPFRNIAIKRGWAPVTTAETIEYKKSIKAFTRVSVQTKLLCWDSKRFYLEQVFLVQGKIHAICYLEGFIRGPEGTLEPPKVFTTLGLSENSPPMPVHIEKWLSSRSVI